jgi:hypothetical protein
MDTKILEQLEEALGDEFNLVEHDLGSLEDTVNEKMRLWGKGLLQRLLQQGKNGYKGAFLPCECGGGCGL